MKAAVRTRYGPPEAVRIAEVEKPAPKDNEVLVRVHATTVNRTDCGLRAAKPFIYRFLLGLSKPRVTVLGTGFAGGIEAVGGGVTSFQVGDRVFGFNGSSFGAHAEYLVTPVDGLLATVPADLSYEEVAPGTEGAHGPKGQNPILALVTPLRRGKRVMFPLPLRPDQEIARYLRGLLESGAFRPVIDRRYPLDQIVEAYRYVETGRKIGNVVITVVPPA